MDQDQAAQIAITVLYGIVELNEGDEIIITYAEVIDEGWYFECNSRIYMETDDPLYALVTAPIIVRHDGGHRFVF